MPYLAPKSRTRKADIIVALGSDSEEIGRHAAKLFKDHLAPLVLLSGKRGRLSGCLDVTEASFLETIVLSNGVPREAIILEENSTNALENIRFSLETMQRRGLRVKQAILLTQPVLQRRVWATAKLWWPEIKIINNPPRWKSAFDKMEREDLLCLARLAVGEIDRLKRYAHVGHVYEEELPAEIQSAYSTTNEELKTIDKVIEWSVEVEFSVQHAMLAHSQFSKTHESSVRHHDQITPYLIHPIWCAMTLLAEVKLNPEIRRLGYQVLLWHDTLEDSNLPLPPLADQRVHNLVREMTFDSFEAERAQLWHRSDIVKLLKLYDKVSNLLDGSWMSPEKWARYLKHTKRLISFVSGKYGELNIVTIARAVCNRGV